jgi:hypothetical protein
MADLNEDELQMMREHFAHAAFRIQQSLRHKRHTKEEVLPVMMATLLSLAHVIAVENLNLSEDEFLEACRAGYEAVDKATHQDDVAEPDVYWRRR